MRCLAVTAIVAVLTSSAAAQGVGKQGDAALAASAKLLQGSHLCAEVLGDSYIGVARIQVEETLRSMGLSGDALTVAVADADASAKRIVSSYPPITSIVGKNGVTRADVILSCQEQIGAAMFEARNALAKYRSSGS